MPQSHPTTGPVRFLSPVRFLARQAEWRARRNFTSVLFSWSHQATDPYGLTQLYTYGLVEWFAGLYGYPIRCPHGHRTGPQENLQCFWYPTGLVRDRKGTVRHRYGHVMELIPPEWHNHARASYLAVRAPYGPLTVPVRAVHGLFRISKPVRGPYAYNACIKTQYKR